MLYRGSWGSPAATSQGSGGDEFSWGLTAKHQKQSCRAKESSPASPWAVFAVKHLFSFAVLSPEVKNHLQGNGEVH